MEAQRYPADYDGILAGAPANNWTGLLSMAAADTDALIMPPGAFIPQSKIPTIAHAVTAICDQIDVVRDGILNDPRQCKFDPVSIQCKEGEDTDKCLTGPQVTALKVIYAGLRDAKGQLVHPGFLPGAEEGSGGFGGWDVWIMGPAPEKSTLSFFAKGFFSDMVFEKADWDLKTFNVDRDLPIARQKTAAAIDAVNPNLSAFRSHGGTLILYHGWNDPAIPAVNTVNYYEEVIGSAGRANANSFVRLYMVPGMQHCFGGPGADEFGQWTWDADPKRSARTALENWVEKGTAPGVIIASKTEGAAPSTVGSVVMTRPLCPYPQQARYKGSGDPNRDENFACAAAKNSKKRRALLSGLRGPAHSFFRAFQRTSADQTARMPDSSAEEACDESCTDSGKTRSTPIAVRRACRCAHGAGLGDDNFESKLRQDEARSIHRPAARESVDLR